MIVVETVIVLVNYNGYQDTLECIKSINKTAGQLPFIVLVDNASKNAKELECLKKEYAQLFIIYNQENLGFGRANNIGIKWAKENIDFKYLLLLNNDTLIENNTIVELIKPFATDEAIGITTAKTFYESDREIIWYGGGDINYKRGWPRICDYNSLASEEGANKSKYVSFVSGCCMMFTKKSMALIKGFDEDFFMYCEDLELCMRASKLELKLYYNADSVVYHKVQGSLQNTLNEVKGMNALNPNLEFLFYNMKTNQYKAVKKHYFSSIFFMLYWLEFSYRIMNFVIKGRYVMIKTGFKVIKENYK